MLRIARAIRNLLGVEKLEAAGSSASRLGRIETKLRKERRGNQSRERDSRKARETIRRDSARAEGHKIDVVETHACVYVLVRIEAALVANSCTHHESGE